MSSLLRFISNLIKMLPWFKPSVTRAKRAREEVKRVKKEHGMDSVRDDSSRWFDRKRRR